MANVITCIRIICGLLLIPCPAFSTLFYVLYIVGGISDAADGFVARKTGSVSDTGARLDTIADTVFMLTVLVKLLLSVSFPVWLIIWIGVIAAVKCMNVVSGFMKYRHFVSVHTIMNKICGILFFIIPLCIGVFPWQPSFILIILTCAVSTFAAVQEGHYIRSGKHIDG